METSQNKHFNLHFVEVQPYRIQELDHLGEEKPPTNTGHLKRNYHRSNGAVLCDKHAN